MRKNHIGIAWMHGSHGPRVVLNTFFMARVCAKGERENSSVPLVTPCALVGGDAKQDHLPDPTFFCDTYLGLTYPSANLSALILYPAGGGMLLYDVDGNCCCFP